jgi:hypothetical protein
MRRSCFLFLVRTLYYLSRICVCDSQFDAHSVLCSFSSPPFQFALGMGIVFDRELPVPRMAVPLAAVQSAIVINCAWSPPKVNAGQLAVLARIVQTVRVHVSLFHYQAVYTHMWFAMFSGLCVVFPFGL